MTTHRRDLPPVPPADRRVANLAEGTWVRCTDETGAEEGEVLHVNPRNRVGEGFHLYRMAPGEVTLPHRHEGDEEFLVIEGELIDHDGFRYGPGDLVWLRAGTAHWSRAPEGCLLAVYLSGSSAVTE